MKAEKDVLDIVFTRITAAVPKFRRSYPDNYIAQKFIVINTLGVPRDAIQVVEVNVNCYAKDFDSGITDESTLATMLSDVIDDLHGYHWHGNTKVYIGYQSMVVLREQSIKMHYVNARFQLTFLNN